MLLNSIFSFTRPPNFRIGSIGAFVGAVGVLLFATGLLVVFVLLVWGAVQWITSGGDKANIQKARSIILNALGGLALLSLGAAIIYLLQAFFGIKIIGNGQILPRAFP